MANRKKIYTTTSTKATRDLAREILPRLLESNIVCLHGDLGAGKTTFAQGLLKALGARGPYTSPTFAIMKEYKLKAKSRKLKAVYHIDAYRIGPDDMLELGWEELVANKQNFFIIEWPERIRKIIPAHACWIEFAWLDEQRRKISLP